MPPPPRGLNDIFADDDAAADQVENLFDADEMAGFIEDDSDDEGAAARSQAGDSDEDLRDRDDARERRNRKQKERERRKAEGGAAKRRRGGLGGGRLEGVSVEAWQEVAEVFGNGQEYAWAMEDEDEDEPKPKDLKDVRLFLLSLARAGDIHAEPPPSPAVDAWHRSLSRPRLPRAC